MMSLCIIVELNFIKQSLSSDYWIIYEAKHAAYIPPSMWMTMFHTYIKQQANL